MLDSIKEIAKHDKYHCFGLWNILNLFMIDLIEYNDLPYICQLKLIRIFNDECIDEFERMGLKPKSWQIRHCTDIKCDSIKYYNDNGNYYKVETTLI